MAKSKSVSKPKLSKLDRLSKGLRSLKRTVTPKRLRKSITPGTVLIVLAGPYAGKRVICLKEMGIGSLLVTGPFRINRVPLTRIGQTFVIATSTKIDLPESVVKAAEGIKSSFFKQLKKDLGTKAKVAKKFIAKAEKPVLPNLDYRKEAQQSVDTELIATIEAKGKVFAQYIASRFNLNRGAKVHTLKF